MLRCPHLSSVSNCVEERQHFRPQQFWTGPVVHGKVEGLQMVDLPFRLAVAPRHLDGVSDSIEVPVQSAGEVHDGR